MAFRHTYCAARLQTLDRGAPVSRYTVSRELGHGSEEMVRRVYAHLGDVRHRSDVVEFRVDQHLDRLGDRLQRFGLAAAAAGLRRSGASGAAAPCTRRGCLLRGAAVTTAGTAPCRCRTRAERRRVNGRSEASSCYGAAGPWLSTIDAWARARRPSSRPTLASNAAVSTCPRRFTWTQMR